MVKILEELINKIKTLPESEQERIAFLISQEVNLVKKRQKIMASSAQLSEIMDKASSEAEANGLTPEILEEILAGE